MGKTIKDFGIEMDNCEELSLHELFMECDICSEWEDPLIKFFFDDFGWRGTITEEAVVKFLEKHTEKKQEEIIEELIGYNFAVKYNPVEIHLDVRPHCEIPSLRLQSKKTGDEEVVGILHNNTLELFYFSAEQYKQMPKIFRKYMMKMQKGFCFSINRIELATSRKYLDKIDY